ncbi:MAG: Crp/Fnr family transcriptional regulator [Hyphomicrobiales bacterium]|nr:Crp/Fnr family transcriptional regulator [Hyphomicrobiales bacterium]
MSSTLTANDANIVHQINIFRGLAPAVIDKLIAPAVSVVFREGEIIFNQAEPATAFFIVIHGWVKLYRITAGGDEAVIRVFANGESFGEAVAFTGASYPATAEAVSDARLARIPAAHVVNCIRAMPEIALAMIASTSQHLHHLVQQVEQLKAQTGVERVAEFLASLCKTQQGECTIALPYDKALIAGRLGLKPESLSRAFARLRTVGVEVKASSVIIHDVAGLHDVAMGIRSRRMAALS